MSYISSFFKIEKEKTHPDLWGRNNSSIKTFQGKIMHKSKYQTRIIIDELSIGIHGTQCLR